MNTAFDWAYFLQLGALGRFTSFQLMNPLGAKLWTLLEVQTTRVLSGTPIFAAFFMEGRIDLIKTKWPTTFVPYKLAIEAVEEVPSALHIPEPF